MELSTFWERNREPIVGRWFDLVVDTYPRGTSEFLAKQKDRFRNPVGHAIGEGLGPIYSQIISAMDSDELLRALDGIIRIRAVQDFAPSDAVAFVFRLKGVIRDVLNKQGTPEDPDELTEIEARIDRVALLAFDKYTECREKLFEVRTNEIKNRSLRLLERANAESAASRKKGEPTHDDV